MLNKTIPDNPAAALQSYTEVDDGEDWLLMVFLVALT